MARLDTTQIVGLATTVGQRAHQVQQDPAVQKAWQGAARDVATAATAVTTAAASIGRAGAETRASWHRTGAITARVAPRAA